jgi:hypothetical protein
MRFLHHTTHLSTSDQHGSHFLEASFLQLWNQKVLIIDHLCIFIDFRLENIQQLGTNICVANDHLDVVDHTFSVTSTVPYIRYFIK